MNLDDLKKLDEMKSMKPQGVIQGASRLGPPPWAELSADERIETLRQEVVNLQRTLSWMGDLARKANAKADLHEHGKDGRPMFSAHTLERSQDEAGSRRNPLV